MTLLETYLSTFAQLEANMIATVELRDRREQLIAERDAAEKAWRGDLQERMAMMTAAEHEAALEEIRRCSERHKAYAQLLTRVASESGYPTFRAVVRKALEPLAN